MTSKILYQYDVYCNTESKYVKIWSETIPSVCPNNNTHEIDSTKTSIVGEIANNAVIAMEPTDGYFKCSCIDRTIPPGVEGNVTTFDVSWPFDIMIWLVDLYVNDNMVGDYININVIPPTIINGIGYVTQATTAGNTIIPVSSTVTDNMVPGFYMKLGSTEVGRCDSVSKANGTVTLRTALEANVAQYSVVYPQLHMVHDFKLARAGVVEFAKKGFKGKPAPANTIFTITYTNMGTTEKSLCIRHEYYYGF